MARGALSGIRIVDLSWVLAGPLTTKMLAGLGAEVIKIESSLRAEFTNRGHLFPVINNSKRSVTINLKTPEGRDLIRKLIAGSDIVVENFSSEVLRKYELDYESVRAIKPDIIFVSASGVGRSGPQKDALAYGTLLQGYSGRASMIGDANLKMERMGILPAWTDPMTAFWEMLAILAAVFNRKRTGEGAYIDQSMLESTVSLLPESLIGAGMRNAATVAHGNEENDASPSGLFSCFGSDSWLALSVRTDAEWDGFCRAAKRVDLLTDRALSGPKERLKAKGRLNKIAADWLATQDAAHAERALIAAGVFGARTRNIVDLLDDELLASRHLFPDMGVGKRTIALPWMEEDGWRGDFTPSPDLGADNAYVFCDILGLSPQDLESLKRREIVK